MHDNRPKHPLYLKFNKVYKKSDFFAILFENSMEIKSKLSFYVGYWSVIFHLTGSNTNISSTLMSLEHIIYENEEKRLKYLIERSLKIHKSLL